MCRFLKIFSMFAMLIKHKGESIACQKFVAGFFYACTILICSAAPVRMVNAPAALVVISNRSVALFFLLLLIM